MLLATEQLLQKVKRRLSFYRDQMICSGSNQGFIGKRSPVDTKRVDDVIVGNAVPEAEQGLQVGRIIAAKAVGFSAPA